MTNPYETLFIYYFDRVPDLWPAVEQEPSFLGTWVEEDMAFLFFSRRCDSLVHSVIAANSGICLVDTYEMTGEEWHGDRIEPYTVEDLVIYPPWQEPEEIDNTRKGILLDPGVVFGTGRHQTTEDCLSLIHRLCTRQKIDSVLDIGTGTGLLALGAARLGCSRVLACDFNRLAVRTALNNIRLNRFEDRVLAFQARGEEILSLPCDLLVANIHYDVMRHLIESPFFLEKRQVILSGLLNSEARKVLSVLSRKKIHVVERRCPDGIWNTILAKP